MQVSDFYYQLPEELIAQEPIPQRDAARMLVISRERGRYFDDCFINFHRYLRPGDCLVLNNTKVFPARLRGRRNGTEGARVEVFLLRALDADETIWRVLVRPAKRLKAGDRVVFEQGLEAEIVSQGNLGERTIQFFAKESISAVLSKIGETPLPPYIRRNPTKVDDARYQTVFAEKKGSVAAPTAGLHFTPTMLEDCRAAGADIATVTLHVGLGTFSPIREEKVSDVRLHEEYFEIEADEGAIMRRANRLLCVGTTSVRTIETACLRGGLTAMQGETNLFIYPGFHFRGTGAMLTNFHLPQSSLLMLVAAFAGTELTLNAYRYAVENRYRFFSYGDCMFIE
ncbi:MAG: tRNA preQ1(34) S-adenosylmethionine ribosyltransferase-isomerase QueA [Acidobacteriaceae bacterium]|nr:tRNA preQ1(34) S-adenosylmethionine ribosyltransferase-isomerase QueA [Acidobacteriaceae bacterium]